MASLLLPPVLGQSWTLPPPWSGLAPRSKLPFTQESFGDIGKDSDDVKTAGWPFSWKIRNTREGGEKHRWAAASLSSDLRNDHWISKMSNASSMHKKRFNKSFHIKQEQTSEPSRTSIGKADWSWGKQRRNLLKARPIRIYFVLGWRPGILLFIWIQCTESLSFCH